MTWESGECDGRWTEVMTCKLSQSTTVRRFSWRLYGVLLFERSGVRWPLGRASKPSPYYRRYWTKHQAATRPAIDWLTAGPIFKELHAYLYSRDLLELLLRA